MLQFLKDILNDYQFRKNFINSGFKNINDFLEDGADNMAFNAMKRLFSVKEIPLIKGKILEVGAGTGRFTREIIKYVDNDAEIIALEKDKKPFKYLLLETSKNEHKNVKPMLGDFFNNSFSSEEFNLIIIPWFDMVTLFRWNKILIESSKLLKNNGILVFDFMDSQEGLLKVVNEPSNSPYNLINGRDLEIIANNCGFIKIYEFEVRFNRQITKYHIYRKLDSVTIKLKN